MEKKEYTQGAEALGYVAHHECSSLSLLWLFLWDDLCTVEEFWLYSFHASTKKWEMKWNKWAERWSHHWELPTIPAGIFLLCNVSYLTPETDDLWPLCTSQLSISLLPGDANSLSFMLSTTFLSQK